jgi:hypothetical protein
MTALDDDQEPMGPAREPIPVREALLRPEFADRYPGMRAGTWYLAATVASAVQHVEAAPPLTLRPLPEAHFEFRGGAPARGSGSRTRSSDRAT